MLIDDIGIFTTSSFEDNLAVLCQVFLRLEQCGVTVNQMKYEWATQQTDYVGVRLISSVIKPVKKKIEAAVHVGSPTFIKHFYSFVGIIKYYKDN